MRRFLTLMLISVLLLPSALPAQDPGIDTSMNQAKTLLVELGDTAFAGPSQAPDIAALREELRRDLDSMHFEDDPLGKEPARSLFGTNPLTGDRNPLLDDRARQTWLASAIARLGIDMVSTHLRKQADAMTSGKIDRSGWYEHIASCTELCNPVVQGLLVEHIQQVSARPRQLATFATNEAGLTAEVSKKLLEFVEREILRDPSVEFLLIGRASRTGARVYNRELSARRVKTVRSFVAAQGVSGDRITGFWLGYEPPQISDEIAKAYELSADLDQLTRNQSVLIVAYRPTGLGRSTPR